MAICSLSFELICWRAAEKSSEDEGVEEAPESKVAGGSQFFASFARSGGWESETGEAGFSFLTCSCIRREQACWSNPQGIDDTLYRTPYGCGLIGARSRRRRGFGGRGFA